MKNESRKIILDLAVTLDGYIEGPKGEIDWCIMEPEMDFGAFLDDIDAIFYGRKSYDLWGQFIPPIDATENDRDLWNAIHSKKKYVFSKKLKKIDGDAYLINKNIEEEVRLIKEEEGKNIWLYGGAGIITKFANLGLIDEYRLSIHPVILGGGKPLFVNIKDRAELELVNVNRLSSGVVQLCYRSIT